MHSVLIDKRVLKDIKSFPVEAKKKIFSVIDKLSINPYPENAKKLTGRDAWRIRVASIE